MVLLENDGAVDKQEDCIVGFGRHKICGRGLAEPRPNGRTDESWSDVTRFMTGCRIEPGEGEMSMVRIAIIWRGRATGHA